jgi:ethanolamine ammonia-lyase small subunit
MAIDLTSFTNARVALGRVGNSLPTAELLRFQLDHARARDAVYAELDPRGLPGPHVLVRSAARDRGVYLRRPDLGRTLSEESRHLLLRGEYDAAIVLADGLSALAVQRYAAPLIDALTPLLTAQEWRMAPLTVVLQARVAIGDEIGAHLAARLIVMLIGERPGLTAPDSLGVYLTYDPRVGRTDAQRNCISNVRPEGLPYAQAARNLHFLMSEARLRKLTGVELKESETTRVGQTNVFGGLSESHQEPVACPTFPRPRSDRQ